MKNSDIQTGDGKPVGTFAPATFARLHAVISTVRVKTRAFMRLRSSAVVAFSFGLLLPFSTANAQTTACLQLQNQLASIGSNKVGASPRYRQFDRAVKDQRAQIKKTKRMARINGCRGAFVTRRNSGTCGRIMNSLDQMNTNLAGLEQQRRRLAPRASGGSDNQRRRIIRAMNQRGCFNTRGQQIARAEPRRRTLAEQIFGVRSFRNDGRVDGFFSQPDLALTSRYGTFRTLCVRKSDGYYFPISFSTAPARFEYDEGICQARCAGSEVELYYHAMPAQDSEDMISFRSQEAYRDMPNAFAYRKKFEASNSCRFSSGIFHEVAGASGEARIRMEESGAINSRIGKPIFRSDRAYDPESLANDAGKLEVAEVDSILNPNANVQLVADGGDPDRKIRVVGPAFYPVQ